MTTSTLQRPQPAIKASARAFERYRQLTAEARRIATSRCCRDLTKAERLELEQLILQALRAAAER